MIVRYQRADDSSSGAQEEMNGTWFPFPPVHNGERPVITIEEEADIRALKFRICNVIKIWMDEYFDDFRGDPPLLPVLITFVLGKLIREGRDTLANILKTSIYNQARCCSIVLHGDFIRPLTLIPLVHQFHTKQLASKIKRLSSSDMMDVANLSPPKPKVGFGRGLADSLKRADTLPWRVQLGKVSLCSPRLSLTDISEEEAARQLTLIEHTLISKLKVRGSQRPLASRSTRIELRTFVVQQKTHDLLNARGKPDVMNAVNYCNRLSLWVVATILHQSTPRARAKMKARFVAIAHVCILPLPPMINRLDSIF